LAAVGGIRDRASRRGAVIVAAPTADVHHSSKYPAPENIILAHFDPEAIQQVLG